MKKFLGLLFIILVIGGIYWYLQKNKNQDVKSYTSQNLGISFKYPSDWSVTEGNDYPGSAQGNNYINIMKGTELVYTSAKQSCINNYKVCKPAVNDNVVFFSTQSGNKETIDTLDLIVNSTKPLQ